MKLDDALKRIYNEQVIQEGDNLKCEVCGREVLIQEKGKGPLICCGKEMVRIGETVQEWGFNRNKEKADITRDVLRKTLELAKKADKKCQAQSNSDPVKCHCKGLKAAMSNLLHSSTTKKCKSNPNCIYNVRQNLQNTAQLYIKHCKKNVNEAGFEDKPKGWTDDSIKKFSKTFTKNMKGNVKSTGFFDKCVKKMQGKIDNPEGFCASLKDEKYKSTAWRGKGKSPKDVKRDVKKKEFKIE